MSPTAIQELPQAGPRAAVKDISHEVCCTDENKATDRISMCGLPISDEDCDSGPPSCTVCFDLIEQWALNVDRYGEDPQLPGDSPCRCCPRRFKEPGWR